MEIARSTRRVVRRVHSSGIVTARFPVLPSCPGHQDNYDDGDKGSRCSFELGEMKPAQCGHAGAIVFVQCSAISFRRKARGQRWLCYGWSGEGVRLYGLRLMLSFDIGVSCTCWQVRHKPSSKGLLAGFLLLDQAWRAAGGMWGMVST